MNPSHVVATGGITGLLAGALVYFSHWPLQPLTDAQAADFAGLIVVGGGLLLNLRRQKGSGNGNGSAPVPPTPLAPKS